MDGNFNSSMEVLPVCEGEEHDLLCEATGSQGDGLCKVERYIVFVEGAQIGKRYKVQITKATRKCGFGKVVEELE